MHPERVPGKMYGQTVPLKFFFFDWLRTWREISNQSPRVAANAKPFFFSFHTPSKIAPFDRAETYEGNSSKERGVSHEFMENPWKPSALLGNLVEDMDQVKKGGADFVTRSRSAIRASNMAPIYRRFERSRGNFA